MVSGIFYFTIGTSGRTRTDTLLKATDFESVMSTNSITLALCMVINVVLMHGIIAMRRAYTTTF